MIFKAPFVLACRFLKKEDAYMFGLTWNISTVVVALIIAVLAILAIRRIKTRGLCDCHDHCGTSSKQSGRCAGCAGCGATQHMLSNMEKL